MKKAEAIRMIVVLALAVAAAVFARDVLDTDEQKLLATNKGNLGADAGFLSKYTQAYQIDEANSTNTYQRWQSGAGTVWIMKISVSGTVTTWEKATGTWANRASLTYEAIND